MLKDVLKKELRQVWLASETLCATELPTFGQAMELRAKTTGRGGVDQNRTSDMSERHPFWPAAHDVLTTARMASGL